MIDHILQISFDSRDSAIEELVESRLFVSASTGSTSVEVNGTMTIEAYFDSAGDCAAAAESLRELGAVELRIAERERVDWLDLYQQSLEPIVIGERFIVAPDASLLSDRSDRLSIVVPQEQAFGTGSHETTALCMVLLETLDLEGERGLDVGSGSGILALAMHRLGAAKVIAFDNDTDAYGALRDNRARNGVPAAAMPLYIGGVDALRDGAFDVVTMNIIPEVIVPLLADVIARMARGARLILSGILVAKSEDVVGAAREHDLVLTRQLSRGEWWAGEFVRSRSRG